MSKLPETWTYATSVKTNLKSPDGGQYQLRLAPKICIVGPNESNKSAIAEALQLAMSGQAAGLAFKTKPAKQDPLLTAMIPWGQQRGYTEVQWGNGSRSSWALTAGKRAVHTGPKMGALPLADIRAALQGNDSTRARFLYGWLCSPMESRAFLARIPAMLHSVVAEVSSAAARNDETPVNVGAFLTAVGQNKRKASSAAKAVDSLLAGLGTIQEVSEDKIEGLQRQLERAATKRVLQTLHAIGKAQPNVPTREALEALAHTLGGKEAVRVIPAFEESWEQAKEAVLHQRLAKTASQAVTSKAHHQGRGDMLSLLEKEVLAVVFSEIHKRGAQLIRSVSRYLPPKQSLCVDWGDDLQPDRVRLGLQKGEHQHFTLSGSTEARFLAALACAAATPENPLVVVEDRMWDATTLAQMMAVLEKSPAQVVVMSSIMPRGRRRKAWQYVEMSRTDGQPLEITNSLSGEAP